MRARTESGITLIELMIAGAITGLLAAVAVPGYTKFVKKAKTAEARALVKIAHDGARTYYMDGHNRRGPDGWETPPMFPMFTTEPTPFLGSCCGDQGDKCTPAALHWEHPTWVALQFSVDDPHHYSYQYETQDPLRQFAVRANGDLDCDGEYSTFEMIGLASRMDPQQGPIPTGGGADGVAGPGGLYREKDLE